MSKQAIALLKECRDSLAECSIDPFDGHRSDADSQTLAEYDEAIEAVQKLVSERDALAVRVRELADLLRSVDIDCQHMHHGKSDMHKLSEPCPVVARAHAAIEAALTTTSGDSHG